MVGAAIGSAVGGLMGANESRKAGKAAAKEAALARADRIKSMEMLEENQANVDALQEFLTSMGAEGMERAQGLLDDWEGTFGGIQDNLSEYYNNLDPEKFALQSKIDFKRNMDKQMAQFNETMAAGGLQSAGMKAQTAKEAAFKTAEASAQIDINAPEEVARMKQGFLEFGDPQRAGAENAYNRAMENKARFGEAGFRAQTEQTRSVAGALTGSAEAHDKYAAGYGASQAGWGQAAGQMFGSAMNLGIKAFDKPAGRTAINPDDGVLF